MKHRFDSAEQEAHYDAKESGYIAGQGHFDAGESVFLAKELEHVRSTAIQVKKSPLNAFQLFPVQTDIPEGAESAVQKYFDGTGVAKLVSSYSDTLPRVDVIAKQETVKVFTGGVSYGYSIDELKNAMFANRPLDAMKATQARRGIDMLINDIAFKGKAENKIVGFLDNTNVSQVTLTAGAGSGNPTAIASKAALEMVKDFGDIINAINNATDGVEVANTVAMTPSLYNTLNSTLIPNINVTVLQFLKGNFPEITRWMKVRELVAAKAGKDVVVCGNFAPDTIRLEVPTRFESLPVERRNLEYVVDNVCRVVGVTIFVPTNFVYANAN